VAQEKRHRASKQPPEDKPGEEEEAVKAEEPGTKESAAVEPPREESESLKDAGETTCPVVGIGASAGGLEALQGLLSHLPSEPPMALVIVQHRATDRTSVMKSLLEKHTGFSVVDIEDGTAIQPNTAYLAPADRDVSVSHGSLYLMESHPHVGVHLPIDSFFRTLAHDQLERGIGIVLSGTGSDGTLGIKEIKAAGGMVMAQKEDQAKYDSMPRNAIDTGMVDFILPVEKMGEQLAQYIRHPFLKARKAPDLDKKLEDQLQKIFMLIRGSTGHDFSHYKRSTIQRRIARRLAVHQIEDLNTYVKLLQESSDEVHTLAKEMLITVTNFFRDAEAFDALKESVIGPLVQQRSPDVPIRIWVPACATGEEAYSIAIMVHEEMEIAQRRHNVQIFATDLDEESIEVARRGQYPKSIAGDVSPIRLKRYFTEENNHYRVKNGIREMLVFARHNLIKDAPFSRLDLISCRNVLIYMDTTLQKRLIPMFHYTLNRNGFLFLGESESIGTFADLFAPADAKHKVFKRKPVETAYEPEAEVPYRERPEGAEKNGTRPKARLDMSKVAEKMILRDYSLPCVVVDEEYEVVYFNGDTSLFLTQPGGQPTFNILRMARPEIHYKLNMLLKRAFHERHMAAEKDIQLRAGDQYIDLDIVVRPVSESGVADNLMIVVFKSRPRDKKEADGQVGPISLPEQETDARIRELEQELQSTKEYLQTTIEELETSNEELKSSNEELQSTNEELQSTNEELDTSREELQSTNEELRTVNSEHEMKIDELSKAYDDLNNLLGATEVATLFLDHDLRIRRFTPAARKLFRLMDRDVGRPLEDIASAVRYDSLLADIRSVTETLNRVDREIQDENGAWYQMKIVPYRTAENVIEGAVVTFVDITTLRHISLAETIVETVREPLLILDGDLHVIAANPAFYRFFKATPKDTQGRLIYDLGDRQWDIPELRRLLEQIVPKDTRFEGFPVTHDFPGVGRKTMLLNARQTMLKGEATCRILLAIEDVTAKQ
jgi:two-component system CheB/CheR fusion protein